MSKDSFIFQFMIKEYEKLYGKLDSHQSAVEKTIQFYYVLIGALVSFNAAFDKGELNVFKLEGAKFFVFFIIAIVGVITYFKIVEHRLLIIAYVKSINLNRKWFVENSDYETIEEYLFWKADVTNPPFYKPFRHFYWESLGIAIIASLFLAIIIINCLIHLFTLESKHAGLINWLWVIIITFITTYLLMLYYKKKGNYEENKVKERFVAESSE